MHAATAALRAQEDIWTLLFAVLEPHTKATTDKAEIHPMELNNMKTFALVARAHGYQPTDLNESRAQEIDDAYRGNKRTSNRGALDLLDYVRTFPEALPFLPPQPIGFTPAVRKTAAKLPASFEAEFLPWIDQVTRSGWDPVAQASQEHGILAIRSGSGRSMPELPVGTRIRILPNHACAMAAQHDFYSVVNGESPEIEARWERIRGW